MNRETTKSTQSEHTKLKVAVGIFSLLTVVFLVVYITYSNFYKIVHSVELLSSNKNESAAIKAIDNGITAIRTSSTIYSITFQPKDFNNYIRKVKEVHQQIDSLEYRLGKKKSSNAKTDSLNILFREYVTSINNWLALTKASNSNDYTKIASLIEENEESLTSSPTNLPHSNTTTVTHFLEKPLNDSAASILEQVDNGSNKSLFQKIFGNKRKSKEPTKALSPVTQRITTETHTETDTTYYNQVDQLLTKVKESITESEKSKKTRKFQLAKLGMKLLNSQTTLITKINVLLWKIEQEDEGFMKDKIALSKQTANEATNNLMYVVIVALIISLIFLYVIFTDLARSAYYKRMLETEKLETERLAKAKENFLASMSHEIRTPLTSIIGFSEQLQVDNLNNLQKQQVQAIANSSEHLLSIVNDILDYSKIESGKLKFEKIGFSLDAVIEEVIEIMQQNANKKGLQIFYKRADDYNTVLLSGDPFRLKQVLINLVGNSIKFTEKGFVRIEAITTEKKNGYVLHCNIIDTGIGINEEKLKDIFTDFSQADNSTTRNYGGTGLGLPISKRIVEMQDGSIAVKSKPNEGSVFSFEIFYLKAEKNEYHINNSAIEIAGNQLQGKSILIVDDDPVIPVLLEPVLKRWGTEYIFCNRSILALERGKEKKFDILMIDIQMPEMDGLALIHRIKTEPESRNKDAKIIISTGNVMLNADKSVCDQVLYKPFKTIELWEVLCKAAGVESALIPADPVLYDDPATNNLYSLRNFEVYANGDRKTLETFIDSFIAQSKKGLEEMSSAFLKMNYAEIGEVAHKLSNTFGQLEAKEVVQTLKQLQELVDTDQLSAEKIKLQLHVLDQLMGTIFNQLEKELSR